MKNTWTPTVLKGKAQLRRHVLSAPSETAEDLREAIADICAGLIPTGDGFSAHRLLMLADSGASGNKRPSDYAIQVALFEMLEDNLWQYYNDNLSKAHTLTDVED